MNIKLTHPNAKVPTKAHKNDAGWDLYIAEELSYEEDGAYTYDFGVAFDIPNGYVGLVFPRSSVYKTGTILSNCVGVIDSGYTGSVKAKFFPHLGHGWMESDIPLNPYEVGDRAAQILFIPLLDIESLNVVKYFNHITDRQDSGFGSSGK